MSVVCSTRLSSVLCVTKCAENLELAYLTLTKELYDVAFLDIWGGMKSLSSPLTTPVAPLGS